MERVAITTCLEVKSLLPEENNTILVWRLCFTTNKIVACDTEYRS